MKGGYQILDLTGATAGSPVEVKGIYKAAAGNNGKPVLILTNDGQRVYAEIAEDDGDYITCYISAEGKTVNITIKSDDSVTTVVSDPGASITGLEQAVNEIATNIGDVDDLTTTSKVVVGAINELNNKVPFLYITTDTTITLSGGPITTITLPAGKYVFWDENSYSDNGILVYFTNFNEYTNTVTNFTLNSETLISLNSPTSLSNTWTHYRAYFLKVG